RAVALEFVGADTPSAEHHRQRERPRKQDAPGWAARPGPHADQRKSAAAHGTNLRIRTHEPSVQVANRLALLPPNALFRASGVPGGCQAWGRGMTNIRKILIVDDDSELREALVEQLALHEEFESIAVDNGTKGVQTAKAGQIDLVIMDVGLPDVDG